LNLLKARQSFVISNGSWEPLIHLRGNTVE
jgi:hypothetical protein